jgi:hypothetical protein
VIRLGQLESGPTIGRLAPPESRQGDPPAGPNLAFTTCRDATGSWWWWDAVGAFHVSTDARLIEVYPEPAADEQSVALVLTGPLAAFVMYRLGHPALHGSAIATASGAVAFLGAAGYGKSTIAAAFLHKGLALLADDMLPLDERKNGIYVTPSLPLMKLWPSTAEHALGLHAHELPNVAAHLDKKFFLMHDHPSLGREPVLLRGIYVLERYAPAAGSENAIEIRPLRGREALAVILAQMPCGAFLQPNEASRFLPLFVRLTVQAPLRVLRYPGDFAYLDVVCEHILHDLEAR